MKYLNIKTILITMPILLFPLIASADAKWIDTPYSDEQKVIFDFYYDEPDKINSALYWIRSYMQPLLEAPYNLAPEFMSIIVVIHGTEIVTLAKHNYKKYHDTVERMRYYDSLGVKFKICSLAAEDYHYKRSDFFDFVEMVPSAITDIAHWQHQGYALITPNIMSKKHAIEDIR